MVLGISWLAGGGGWLMVVDIFWVVVDKFWLVVGGGVYNLAGVEW